MFSLNILFPLPPLAEHHRIVGKIDKLLAEALAPLDACKLESPK